MILDELKPRSLFDEFGPGFRRNIKSMRLCCWKLAEVAARHLFQVIWLCLRSDSFTKVTSIMNHRLYSGLVRELQRFPPPRLSDYGKERKGRVHWRKPALILWGTSMVLFYPKGAPQTEYWALLEFCLRIFQELIGCETRWFHGIQVPEDISAQTLWQRSLYNRRGCRVQINYASWKQVSRTPIGHPRYFPNWKFIFGWNNVPAAESLHGKLVCKSPCTMSQLGIIMYSRCYSPR